MPQNVLNSKLNARIERRAIHFAATRRRVRASRIPPYRNQTAIDQATFQTSVAWPTQKPAPRPSERKAKPNQSRREFATVNALIGGRRKKMLVGRRVFSWRSWNRYIAPATQ